MNTIHIKYRIKVGPSLSLEKIHKVSAPCLHGSGSFQSAKWIAPGSPLVICFASTSNPLVFDGVCKRKLADGFEEFLWWKLVHVMDVEYERAYLAARLCLLFDFVALCDCLFWRALVRRCLLEALSWRSKLGKVLGRRRASSEGEPNLDGWKVVTSGVFRLRWRRNMLGSDSGLITEQVENING